jgi:hypothetical protein
MRPVTIVAPPNYLFHTNASLVNNNVPAFGAGAMPIVYIQPAGFVRSVNWVQLELLAKTVNGQAFPNPSTPLNRARARNLMRSRLENIYGGARADMVAMIGDYCSFCELPLAGHLLAIEHVAPKSIYPTYTVWWWNFLLACRDCNSIKGNRPARATAIAWAGGGAPTEAQLFAAIQANYYWPDVDQSTYRVIERTYWYNTQGVPVQMVAAAYGSRQNVLRSATLTIVRADVFSGGVLRLNRFVEVQIEENVGTNIAARTITLTGLEWQDTGRSSRRTQVWLLCCQQLDNLLTTIGAVGAGAVRTVVFNGLWNAILPLAVFSGFYSVWVDILSTRNYPAGVNNPNGFATLGDKFVWDTDAANNVMAFQVFPGTDVAQVP